MVSRIWRCLACLACVAAASCGDGSGLPSDGAIADYICFCDQVPPDAPPCNPGYHLCGTVCADNTSVLSCGSLCTPCGAPANATPACGFEACDFACDPGFVRVATECHKAPRPIAPLSTSSVTSRRPTLRWSLPASSDGAHVVICETRTCAQPIAVFDAVGNSGAPGVDLPPGVLFWRLFVREAGVTSSSPSPTWQLTVGPRSTPVDTSWGTALDVNGDGYGDLAVSSSRPFIHEGGATGPALTPAWSAYRSSSVASAGDVNGDGYADVVLGDLDGGFMSVGRAYVHLGGPAGAALRGASVRGVRDEYFGVEVASVGDVNGDGYADIAVGAMRAGPGRAYVYLGSSLGLSGTPGTTLVGPDGGTGGNFGSTMASADFNGDGFTDLVVGASSAPFQTEPGPGRAYAFSGSAVGLATTPSSVLVPTAADGYFGAFLAVGDFNGDGFADLGLGDGTRMYAYMGSALGLSSTPSVVINAKNLAVGDVNGDGYADLAAGGSTLRLYLGGPAGLASTPVAVVDDPDGGSVFGEYLAIGDLDRDGYGDLAVGAPCAPRMGGICGPGRVYVYHGTAGGGLVTGATLLGPGQGVTTTGY